MRLLLIASLLLMTACQQNLFNKQKYTHFHHTRFRGFDKSESKKPCEHSLKEVTRANITEEEMALQNPEELFYVEDSTLREDAAPQQLEKEAIFTPVRRIMEEKKEGVPISAPVDTATVLEEAKVFRNTGITCAFLGYTGETVVVSAFVVAAIDGSILLGIVSISLLLVTLGMVFLWIAIRKMKTAGKRAPGGIKFLAIFSTIVFCVSISLALLIVALLLFVF